MPREKPDIEPSLAPTPAARWAVAATATWAVASLAWLAAVLATMAIDRAPTIEAGRANLAELRPYWFATASAWGALTAMWLALRAAPAATGRFAATAALVLVVAIGARVAVLLTHDEPLLSDDAYRYVFDGANLDAGLNPYLVRPDERVAAPDGERWAGEAATAGLVNNPELHTIYLPMSQWTFALGAALTPDAAHAPPARARVLRGVFALFDVALLVLLLVALRRRGRSAWWLALYAWHPLPIAEIAGSGHQDVIGVALLVAALVVFDRLPRRAVAWTIPLAAAALVKPVAVPVAAFLLRGRPARAWLASLAAGAVACVVIGGPLLIADGGAAIENLRATASRFSLKWAHFGSVYEPLLAGIERCTPAWGNDPQERLARALCLGLFAGVALLIWRHGRDAWAQATALFLAMVLLAPAVHPWYLLWALALVPIARDATTWTASLTLAWGYAVLGDPVEWTVAPWVMAAAYAPVYGVLAFDLAHRRRTPAVHSAA